MIGQHIGHYHIKEKLGEGGMGTVWRATDTLLGREVALKVLPPAFAGDADRLARSAREAQVLASLNHPNIAAIYGVEAGALVMELVEGATLPRPLPLSTALEYARQIAEALEYAHDKGVVHRDLKPANIRISDQGAVKLLDFGLAKLTAVPDLLSSDDPSGALTLTLHATQAGMIVGTAAYMAPEQARGQVVDRRADIWAFGAVLYEMLSGRRLFSGETTTDMLAAVLREAPDWSHLPPDTPRAIRRLLRRCLERDRRKRLQSIGDARIEIEEALASPEQESPEPTRRTARPLAWIAVAAVCASIAGWLGYRELTSRPALAPVMRYTVPVPAGWSARRLALSPDASSLAIAALDETGAQQLWLRPPGALESRLLADGGGSPFWSPDGHWVGFFAGGEIRRIAAGGGAAESVTRVDFLIGATWSRQGDILFSDRVNVLVAPASGGAARMVAAPRPGSGERGYVWPTFLPDGKHFVFTVYSTRREASGVYVRSIGDPPEAGPGRKILDDVTNVQYTPASLDDEERGYLVFARGSTLSALRFDARRRRVEGEPIQVAQDISVSPIDGTATYAAAGGGLLVYSPWSGGDRMLWYDRNGKPVGAIGETGLHLRPRLSPDAGRVAVTCIEPESLAYHVSLAASTAQRETRLTFESPAVHSVWSPDGKLIAYGGARGQERIETRLAVKPADGSGREEILLDSPEPKHPLDWPAGGRYLLFERLDGGQKQLWVLPVGPGMERTPRRLFPDGPPSSDASVSPDGRWIAYQSPSLGRGEIYVEPFLPDQPGRRGGRWQISRGSAGPPRWRRDGRELYYLTPGRDLMAVEVLAGAGFEAGPPKPLFRAAMVLPFGWFDVSPDGQRFLIPVHYDERSKEPPIAVLNWARLQP